MTYYTLILLENPTSVKIEDKNIDGVECKINVESVSTRKEYDCIVTDLNISDLKNRISGVTLSCDRLIILGQRSNSYTDRSYRELLGKHANLRFVTNDRIVMSDIGSLLMNECMRALWRQGKIGAWAAFRSGVQIRSDVLGHSSGLQLLLLPLVLIFVYYFAQWVALTFFETRFSLLCGLIDYKPDCTTDWRSEAILLTLGYSVFNLLYYFTYVLKMLENVDTTVVQKRTVRAVGHGLLRFLVPLLFFWALLIVFKSIFFFLHNPQLESKLGLVGCAHVEDAIDGVAPLARLAWLLVVFFLLDMGLWAFASNYLSMNRKAGMLADIHQQNIKSAQKTFFWSMIVSLLMLVTVQGAIHGAHLEPEQTAVIGLVLVQMFYLLVNFHSVKEDVRNQ